MNMLGALTVHPGLPMSELCGEDLAKMLPPSCEYLFIDLTAGRNAFAWMHLRSTMRKLGDTFYRRVLTYTGILMLWAIIAVVMLNAILLTRSRHHVSSLITISSGVVVVFVYVLSAVTVARKLQQTVNEHRLAIKREKMGIDQELLELSPAIMMMMKEQAKVAMGVPPPSMDFDEELMRPLEKLHTVFDSIEEVIGFEDEEMDPVAILDAPANSRLIRATFAIVMTGLFTAVDVYSSSSFQGSYNENGWYDP